MLDFYGDAVNTRTNPALRALLRGYDTLAGDSMAAALGPLGIDAPPALVYVDKGLGAAILRAGVRLWDRAHPSPAAAIKLTRHNLSYPTALLHETGHQVGHLTGWNAELARRAARPLLAPRSAEVAALWRSWASEIAADVHAFAQAGWAPVVALANVVDGATAEVYRHPPRRPAPVRLDPGACSTWRCAEAGSAPAPGTTSPRLWWRRHPPEAPSGDMARIARISLDALDDIVGGLHPPADASVPGGAAVRGCSTRAGCTPRRPAAPWSGRPAARC